jgi:hypothetical protein
MTIPAIIGGRTRHIRNPLNPAFRVKVRPILEDLGNITHAVSVCPRCGGHMAINGGMLACFESIVCSERLPNGQECKGHYYLDLNYEKQLEFVGTAP